MKNENAINNSLNGKKVIILGGSAGLGLATAKLADAYGANVVIVSSNEERLQRALKELSLSSTSYAVDLTKEEQIRSFFAQIGNFDHLVYTAAENLNLKTIAETEVEQAKDFFNLRFWSAFASVKYAAPLLNPGGSISLTSGIASMRPGAGWSVATSICSAMEGFTKAMAVELAPIRVNCVAPGVIQTNLWDSMSAADRENMYQMVSEQSLVKRSGKPEDVAEAFLYLISQKFGTGQTIVIDGGAILV
ncbi:NAD(P)-dependent dehydrogenase (short-subunit alcohol dehydrogenase family) [Pedobacter cryoconitis]|uniref:NAD(P)-dependent dehydrogenase (Short-subunit alcohol dehydrogenase family) n=2 Tax=Pedobacter cryoconitis TaxID=188932 RepID=A0A7W8ZQF7_9SPHI|nr:SDR family oxidoreductase [Pedobacter cryoconitis]MBB5638277.1 NAD(P)-dependent dehydrogenase (short-subunit alcohol dehydrogenase family) [Pedobacter cryoconitis]